ncbi:MAG: tRNA (adenosine(37)-N6)-threonylcarbamoyltransferase complex transferase subunit TsaD [Chthoniobacterales bacterium]
MIILAIESSCDETAVALLQDCNQPLGSSIASQIELHNRHGGVVPELASRTHLESIFPLVEKTLQQAAVDRQDIDYIAATSGPGLAPALLVGNSFAKGLAIALDRPYLAVNHIEGHLLSPFFRRPDIPEHINLIVSGGHTLLVHCRELGKYEVLGKTRDDAAGEAFDKAAKLLGLPYPGGKEIDTRAQNGDPTRYDFPRSMLHSGDFDFSFSGLKTSLRYLIEKQKPTADDIPDLCASFQVAIIDILCGKALAACEKTGITTLAVSGGVSANNALQKKLQSAIDAHTPKIRLHFAPPDMRMDNAMMIAYTASLYAKKGNISPIESDIETSLDWLKS